MPNDTRNPTSHLHHGSTIRSIRHYPKKLCMSLPFHKYQKWHTEIQCLLNLTKVNSKDLEMILGCLNHVACIYSPMQHFLGRIYQALYRANLSKNGTVLREAEVEDFRILQTFLTSASKGISMNYITFCKPTHVYRSAASEFGMGGYTITSGIAWHYELTVDYRLCTSINSLEFIACMINTWVDSFHGILTPESCLLSHTDSSSASGWLRKTNFADKVDETIQLTTARKLATLLIGSESNLYSQWFPGDDNSIADPLSRDFHIHDTHLSFLLTSHFPEQTPFGLKILPLPLNIVSWLTSLLLSQPQKKPWSQEPTQSKFALGLASTYTLPPLDYSQTHTLTTSPRTNGLSYLPPSPTPSEKADFVLKNIINRSNQTRSNPPWIAWLRPLDWQEGQTPEWTPTTDLHTF